MGYKGRFMLLAQRYVFLMYLCQGRALVRYHVKDRHQERDRKDNGKRREDPGVLYISHPEACCQYGNAEEGDRR